MSIDLAAVMDALASGATSAAGLERGYGWPVDTVSPPAVVVGYPEEFEYDQTFGNTTDRATFPVWVVVGRVSTRAARDAIGSFVPGGGGGLVTESGDTLLTEDGDTLIGEAESSAIKAHLDGNLGGKCDSANVARSAIEAVVIGGIDFLAARYDVDVIG